MKIKKKINILIMVVALMGMTVMPSFATSSTTSTTATTATTQPTTTTESVQRTITKTYDFKTETKPFKYDAPKTITEGDYIYESKNITYKENSATKPIEKTKSFYDLTSKSVPNTITENGKTLYLQGTPTYTAKNTPARTSTQTITDTRTYNNVVPGRESQTIKNTITKNGTTLKKTGQSYTTSSRQFTDTGALAAYDHDMNVSGTSIQLSDDSPRQGDWRSDLKSYFGLSSGSSISDADWASDIQHKPGTNKYTRTVAYSGERTVYNYTVKYSGTKTVQDSAARTTYDATAKYASKDKISYSVTATVTYEMTPESVTALENKEKEEREAEQEELLNETSEEETEGQTPEDTSDTPMSDKNKIIAGSIAGLLLLAGLITGIILYKRKNQTPVSKNSQDDLDKLFGQANSIKNNKNAAKKESEKERAIKQKKENAKKEKEEKARKAAEEKEKRRLAKEQEYEEKKKANEQRKKENRSPLMKKFDQIKEDIDSDD